jgi:hypothetical protein
MNFKVGDKVFSTVIKNTGPMEILELRRCGKHVVGPTEKDDVARLSIEGGIAFVGVFVGTLKPAAG